MHIYTSRQYGACSGLPQLCNQKYSHLLTDLGLRIELWLQVLTQPAASWMVPEPQTVTLRTLHQLWLVSYI